MDLPSYLIDASDLRQVPDNQEVFISPNSSVSFVIEILQRVEVDDAEGAAKFHFDSLAHDNSATSQEISEITLPAEIQGASLPATPHPIIIFGNQQVRKWNSQIADQVRILMALYRIEGKGVDLVFTANVPHIQAEGRAPDEAMWQTAKQDFTVAAKSLEVVDFGLFA